MLGGRGGESRSAHTMGFNILKAIVLAWGIVVASYILMRAGAETVIISPEAARVKDCDKCPQMVILNAGSLQMGATAQDVEWIFARGSWPDAATYNKHMRELKLEFLSLGSIPGMVRAMRLWPNPIPLRQSFAPVTARAGWR